jgi:predicted HicB family RNase H-like nuclease
MEGDAPARRKRYTRQIALRMPEEMYQALADRAQRDGLDLADVIRQALREWLGLNDKNTSRDAPIVE